MLDCEATLVEPEVPTQPMLLMYTWLALPDDQVRVTGEPEDAYAEGLGERVTWQVGVGADGVYVMMMRPGAPLPPPPTFTKSAVADPPPPPPPYDPPLGAGFPATPLSETLVPGTFPY